MIIKEMTGKAIYQGVLEQAGHRAELEMAFYLRRFFNDNSEIFILHDFSIFHKREKAQIDHLIVHAGGFIIIESKSVASEIFVDDQMQWSRAYQGKHRGMRSPIIQCEMQEMLLKNNLRTYCDKKWANAPLSVLVAISDSGMIRSSVSLGNVVKADQVPSKIRAILEQAPPYFTRPELLSISCYCTSVSDQHAVNELESIRRDPKIAPEDSKGLADQLLHDIATDSMSDEEIYDFYEKNRYQSAFEAVNAQDWQNV